jgi:hypothetical protein
VIGASFSEALVIAASAALEANRRSGVEIRVLRDILGRVMFLANGTRSQISTEQVAILEAATDKMHPFVEEQPILTTDDFYSRSDLFASSEWEKINSGTDGSTVLLMDRQVSGEDWSITRPDARSEGRGKRIVFFSIKGGVGLYCTGGAGNRACEIRQASAAG